jgi:hypothetical protein
MENGITLGRKLRLEAHRLFDHQLFDPSRSNVTSSQTCTLISADLKALKWAIYSKRSRQPLTSFSNFSESTL